MWTSPLDQPGPSGKCWQFIGQRPCCPLNCQHFRASRPQAPQAQQQTTLNACNVCGIMTSRRPSICQVADPQNHADPDPRLQPPLPELPSALPVCRGLRRQEGQDQEALSARRGDDAPGEARVCVEKASEFLEPGATLDALHAQGRSMSDNEAAVRLNEARRRLFLSIQKRSRPAA